MLAWRIFYTFNERLNNTSFTDEVSFEICFGKVWEIIFWKNDSTIFDKNDSTTFAGIFQVFLFQIGRRFFGVFTTFKNLVVIKLIIAIKTLTINQMKYIIYSYFLLALKSRITFENVEISAVENFIFWGVCGKAHTPGI